MRYFLENIFFVPPAEDKKSYSGIIPPLRRSDSILISDTIYKSAMVDDK